MTKFAGERVLSESRCDFCILRLEWTYGRNGNNFVTKIVERARGGGMLKVVDDQVGSPTATTEAAQIICQIIEKRPKGVFHFAAEGYVSRFGVAEFIVEKLGMRVELKRCSSKEFKSAAKRPLNSRFNCKKIKSCLSAVTRPWQQPLEEFITQL
jgi:dTDP-4-dehydrorhamnose reductase